MSARKTKTTLTTRLSSGKPPRTVPRTVPACKAVKKSEELLSKCNTPSFDFEAEEDTSRAPVTTKSKCTATKEVLDSMVTQKSILPKCRGAKAPKPKPKPKYGTTPSSDKPTVPEDGCLQSSVDQLSVDILREIFSFLSLMAAARRAYTCKRWIQSKPLPVFPETFDLCSISDNPYFDMYSKIQSVLPPQTNTTTILAAQGAATSNTINFSLFPALTELRLGGSAQVAVNLKSLQHLTKLSLCDLTNIEALPLNCKIQKLELMCGSQFAVRPTAEPLMQQLGANLTTLKVHAATVTPKAIAMIEEHCKRLLSVQLAQLPKGIPGLRTVQLGPLLHHSDTPAVIRKGIVDAVETVSKSECFSATLQELSVFSSVRSQTSSSVNTKVTILNMTQPLPPSTSLQCLALVDLGLQDLAVFEGWLTDQLRTIDLKWNFINTIKFNVPAALNNVTQLDVSHNFLQTLSGIQLFPNLTKLDCSLNPITSILQSQEVGGLPVSLTYLDLTECRLGAVNLPLLGSLCNLTYLSLCENPIMQFPDDFFKTMIKLEELNISATRIVSIPSSIATLSKLCKVDMSYNGMEEIPPCLVSLPKLTCLKLHFNPFTTQVPITLGLCSSEGTAHRLYEYLTEGPTSGIVHSDHSYWNPTRWLLDTDTEPCQPLVCTNKGQQPLWTCDIDQLANQIDALELRRNPYHPREPPAFNYCDPFFQIGDGKGKVGGYGDNKGLPHVPSWCSARSRHVDEHYSRHKCDNLICTIIDEYVMRSMWGSTFQQHRTPNYQSAEEAGSWTPPPEKRYRLSSRAIAAPEVTSLCHRELIGIELVPIEADFASLVVETDIGIPNVRECAMSRKSKCAHFAAQKMTDGEKAEVKKWKQEYMMWWKQHHEKQRELYATNTFHPDLRLLRCTVTTVGSHSTSWNARTTAHTYGLLLLCNIKEGTVVQSCKTVISTAHEPR